MEVSLVGTIGASSVTTARTRLTGFARVNEDNGNIGPVSFVDNHVFKLPESPIAHHPIEPLAASRPVTNTVKAFHDDSTIGNTSHDVNYLSGNLMVDISGPTGFLAFASPDPVQPFLLSHALAIGLKPSPSILDSFARPEFDDAWTDQRCCFRYPQIYAEELSTITDGRHRCRTANRQIGVPFAVSFKDLSVTINQRKSIHIALRHAKREPEILRTLAKREPQDPSVAIMNELVGVDTQADRKVAINSRPRCFLEIFRLAHSPIAASHADNLIDGHASIIRRQTQITHLAVASMVDFVSAGSFVFFSKIKSHLDSSIKKGPIGFKNLAFALGGL